MPKAIQGKEVLEALAEFKEPVTLEEIVRYVAEASSQSADKVKKLVEDVLNGGVRYGFVQKHNEFYYRVCDAVDAIDDSTEMDDDDEIDSAESLESVDSGDVTPEPKSKKGTESRPVNTRMPSRKVSKTKKINKYEKDRRSKKPMDMLSDEEEEEDEDEYAHDEHRSRRSHKCCSDCDSFHRTQSIDDHGYLRARSRSASRRR
ncbi:uncharacterized protein LOC105212800 [Zeugodacus cucurbitae]|uniref:DNA ligase 4 n=1 Tax=Zeugodacus cucurbitae TaxID=28588 RepID=A0A0A1X038_ZEUCU|nr:uncharacterized protein LOC105212800 [Zeugodacus cucurbitae]